MNLLSNQKNSRNTCDDFSSTCSSSSSSSLKLVTSCLYTTVYTILVVYGLHTLSLLIIGNIAVLILDCLDGTQRVARGVTRVSRHRARETGT
jgi:hypothetical protein